MRAGCVVRGARADRALLCLRCCQGGDPHGLAAMQMQMPTAQHHHQAGGGQAAGSGSGPLGSPTLSSAVMMNPAAAAAAAQLAMRQQRQAQLAPQWQVQAHQQLWHQAQPTEPPALAPPGWFSAAGGSSAGGSIPEGSVHSEFAYAPAAAPSSGGGMLPFQAAQQQLAAQQHAAARQYAAQQQQAQQQAQAQQQQQGYVTLEQQRAVRDAEAHADLLMASYSDATRRSLQNVDEEQINYELLEALLAYILRTEAARGPDALVAQARHLRHPTAPPHGATPWRHPTAPPRGATPRSYPCDTHPCDTHPRVSSTITIIHTISSTIRRYHPRRAVEWYYCSWSG